VWLRCAAAPARRHQNKACRAARKNTGKNDAGYSDKEAGALQLARHFQQRISLAMIARGYGAVPTLRFLLKPAICLSLFACSLSLDYHARMAYALIAQI
jgi:hypothetical protein